jgi:hypothetical protein
MNHPSTNNQENKLTMYEAVQTLLDANGEKTAGYPAFADTVARFGSTVEGIKIKVPSIGTRVTTTCVRGGITSLVCSPPHTRISKVGWAW